MGFRFQKRIKILPGITLNLSKSGVSTSLGVKGATVNVKNGKARASVGVPGTGISYRSGYKPLSDDGGQPESGGIPTWIVVIVIGFALLVFFRLFA